MGCEKFAELRALERAAHHPDRARSLQRDEAHRRMMIANMLIDQALASKAG